MGSKNLLTDKAAMLCLLEELYALPVQSANVPQEALKMPVGMLRLLQDMPVPVHAVRVEDGRVIFWNRRCEEITGYSGAEMVGTALWGPLGPNLAYLRRKLHEALFATVATNAVECSLIARDGTQHRVAWTRLRGVALEEKSRELWCVGTGVARRSNADRLLLQPDKLLRSVFGNLPDVVCLMDGQGRWLLANPPARIFFGLPGSESSEALGLSSLEMAERGHPLADGLRQSALNQEAAWQSEQPLRTEEIFIDAQGLRHYFDVTRVPVFGPSGLEDRQHMLVVRRDVTHEHHAAIKLELAGKVLEHSNDGIMIADAEQHVIMVNAEFSEITGFTSDEVRGRNIGIIQSEQHDAAFHQTIAQALAAHDRWSGEVWNRRKSGEVYPQWLHLSVLRQHNTPDARPEITHYIAAFSDLSSSKAAEEKIAYLSTQDLITGLPNRTQSAMRAELMLEHAATTREQLALMVIDIDNFKMLNDSLGHAAGDMVLRVMGARLQEVAGAKALVGRLSGDEFMVVFPAAYGTAEVAHAVRSLMDAAAVHTVVGGLPMSFSISVGVAMFPADGESFDALFGRADSALHVAKRDGRANYHFASATMNDAALARLQLESTLRRAIDNNELRLEYQPLIDLSSDRIVGVEALCRWDDPERGPISPMVFIPVAEECGLIQKLGGWVLKTAARQLRQLHDAGYPDLSMAVNLSARQFQRGVVLQQVEAALMESGIHPNKLELELTESVLLHDEQAVTNTLRQLKALGVKLAIDDFGTGYSSFAYLRRFKFDKIKIDQSFVRDLIDDPDNAAIVHGIISLGLSLGLNVLAEGVETGPIAQRLKRLQCTHAQGYFFARPLRPAALLELLRG